MVFLDSDLSVSEEVTVRVECTLAFPISRQGRIRYFPKQILPSNQEYVSSYSSIPFYQDPLLGNYMDGGNERCLSLQKVQIFIMAGASFGHTEVDVDIRIMAGWAISQLDT